MYVGGGGGAVLYLARNEPLRRGLLCNCPKWGEEAGIWEV